jgi:hypothetical protein
MVIAGRQLWLKPVPCHSCGNTRTYLVVGTWEVEIEKCGLVIAALFGEAIITIGILAFAVMTCKCAGGQNNGVRYLQLQGIWLYSPSGKQERPTIPLLWLFLVTPSLLISAFEWLTSSVSIAI